MSADKVEHIGKRDVAWSYLATIFMIGAGVILLPFILNKMSAETVGIWNIFQVITSLVVLLDFGFRPSFARNVSYIFSGVRTLQVDGVAAVEGNGETDYALLKGALTAMRRFYRWIGIGVFVLLSTAGTAYIWYILSKYNGDKTDVLIAWILFVCINSYNLYTFYYDALLTGKGYIRQSQQITMLGQGIYLLLAIGLIYAGCGLTAIVVAQMLSVVVRRVLAYRVFFTRELKAKLAAADERDPGEIIRAISTNAIKVGLTFLGGFFVNQSSVLFGSAFLSLEQVACYGITMQVMGVLAQCGSVIYKCYIPKLAQCRAEKNMLQLKQYYVWSVVSLVAVYIMGGIAWIFLGDWALSIIHSQTGFVATGMLLAMLLISLLEQNHIIAAGFIMADNKVPFFIPSLLSGAATALLLYVFLGPLHWGLWGMILAPGIAQLVYQNWKWPSMFIQEIRKQQ